jgi:hypothetical protein
MIGVQSSDAVVGSAVKPATDPVHCQPFAAGSEIVR